MIINPAEIDDAGLPSHTYVVWQPDDRAKTW